MNYHMNIGADVCARHGCAYHIIYPAAITAYCYSCLCIYVTGYIHVHVAIITAAGKAPDDDDLMTMDHYMHVAIRIIDGRKIY